MTRFAETLFTDQTSASSISSTSTALVANRKMSGLMAVFFGLLLIAGAGFAQSSVLHDATHDTRHAFGLPCH